MRRWVAPGRVVDSGRGRAHLRMRIGRIQFQAYKGPDRFNLRPAPSECEPCKWMAVASHAPRSGQHASLPCAMRASHIDLASCFAQPSCPNICGWKLASGSTVDRRARNTHRRTPRLASPRRRNRACQAISGFVASPSAWPAAGFQPSIIQCLCYRATGCTTSRTSAWPWRTRQPSKRHHAVSGFFTHSQ